MTTHDTRVMAEGTDNQVTTRTFWLLGHRFRILADHTDTGGRYDLIEGRPQPGQQTPLHRHTRYAEQFYVLDGELTVWAGRRRVVLRAGDTFTVPAGTAHAVAATSESQVHSLVIASPSGFARVIAEAGTADSGDAPPTPAELERFNRVAAEVGDEILGPPGALPTTHLDPFAGVVNELES